MTLVQDLFRTELIFFTKKRTLVLLFLCLLLFNIELFLEAHASRNQSPNIDLFIIQTHLGKIGLALSLVFLHGLAKDFRIKKIHLFIANGYSAIDYFILKVLNICLISITALFSAWLAFTTTNLTIYDANSTTPSLFTFCLYFVIPAFLAMLLFLFFCITRRAIFSILLLVAVAIGEQLLKKIIGISPHLFPLTSLSEVINTGRLNSAFLFYLLFVSISTLLYVRSVKNWDLFN